MKTVFYLAILVGFAGTLAGVHFLPVGAHARLPSHTAVVANGGRSEQLVIRLPADRIAATDSPLGGLRSANRQGAMVLPAQFIGTPLLVEHFKVRDSAGSVIGVAARHWTETANGASTTWSVLIPSRGAMILSAPGEPRGTVESALQRAGYSAGKSWVGQAKVAMTPEAGTLEAGSGEFEGLLGSYTENWLLAGVSEGELLGTIELNTVTRRQP